MMYDVERGGTYTDKKYETDLIVEYVNDLVVMAKEAETGHNNIYRREDFSDNNSRFIKNDKN